MESIKELRKICQNRGYQEHPTLRFYRLFSIYVTKIFLILKVRPEFIVVLSFLSGIIGGYFYLASHFILGSIFFVISIFLDQVDGEVARGRKLVTTFGGWLDFTNAHFTYPYFFFTLGLGIFFQIGVFWYIILGSVAGMAKLLERSRSQSLAGVGKSDKVFKSQNIILTKEWLSYIAKAPVLFLVILLCSIAGWEIYFLWFFAIYLAFFALGKVFLTGWRIYKREQ